MGVVLQRQNESHYQNPDGSYTAIVSDGLNYLSNGEWKDSDTYYLVGTGDGAWSNESDQYHMTLVGGVVSTPDGWWQVEGIYAGDTKLWTPDFGNYGKIGDTVTYLTPWGTLKYTIRPDSYTEVFTFDRNPLAGTLYDGDLTIKYLGGVDSVVWATDARDRDLTIVGSLTEKTIPRDDLYRATYPLKVDPTDSFGASGDAYAVSTNGVLFPYASDRLRFGNSRVDDGKGNITYHQYRSLLRFSLSSIAGATVSAATFGVNRVGGSTTSTPVVGSAATADPTAMDATRLWNAVSGTSLGTISLPSGVNSWATLTGTALRNFVGGRVGGFCSIGITDGGTGEGWVASSRYTANTSQRPYLSVTYTIPSGYSLTYNANGGANPPTQQTGSTSYTVAAQGAMTRSGYSFVNWNTLANGTGTSYAAGSTINLTANTTLYAIWAVKAPEPIWCDNFNRANSSTVGNGWTQSYAGSGLTYGVNGNTLHLYQPADANGSFSMWRAYAGGLQSNAVSVEVPSMTGVGSNSRVIIGLGSDNTSVINNTWTGYRAYLYASGVLYLHRVYGGASTALITVTGLDVSQPCSFGFDRDGSALALVFNGNIVGTATDDAIGSVTHVCAAMWARNNAITKADNLCIWEAADYPPPTPQPVTTRRHRVISGGF